MLTGKDLDSKAFLEEELLRKSQKDDRGNTCLIFNGEREGDATSLKNPNWFIYCMEQKMLPVRCPHLQITVIKWVYKVGEMIFQGSWSQAVSGFICRVGLWVLINWAHFSQDVFKMLSVVFYLGGGLGNHYWKAAQKTPGSQAVKNDGQIILLTWLFVCQAHVDTGADTSLSRNLFIARLGSEVTQTCPLSLCKNVALCAFSILYLQGRFYSVAPSHPHPISLL